jgi:DNA-binding transcriptional regulator YhcF (GntR family)
MPSPILLHFTIDRDDVRPVWAQIHGEIRRAVDSGQLGPADQLPTVRALASQLGVVPNTVAKAYRALEDDAYLVGRGRAGTFVVEAPPSAVDDSQAALEEAAERFAERVRQLGAGRTEAEAAVHKALT